MLIPNAKWTQLQIALYILFIFGMLNRCSGVPSQVKLQTNQSLGHCIYAPSIEKALEGMDLLNVCFYMFLPSGYLM